MFLNEKTKPELCKTIEERFYQGRRNSMESTQKQKIHESEIPNAACYQWLCFGFYCAELKLAIEIDGPIHDDRQEYDKARQQLIEQRGLTFIRVNNDNVKNNIDYVLEKILNHLLQYLDFS